MNISSEDLGDEGSFFRSSAKKFKKKSEFGSSSKLKSILGSKSRISINGSTGKYDFIYKNRFVTSEEGKIIIVPSVQNSKSQKMVNCLFDS